MEITAMKNLTARLGTPLMRSLVLVVALLATPAISSAAVFVSVGIAPPVLPVYVQPPVPGPGYIWTPGYWSYGPNGYYWVPGTWVLAPFVGALWTPGFWGWGGGAYVWHAGYWGPRVGFYGGVNYGFGYGGVGFVGGSWRGGAFSYNTAVTNVNVTNIHNTYNQTVVQNTAVSRVSYNGGTGGIAAQPTSEERLAERDVHAPPTALQAQHQQLASTNRSLLASVNHGTPALAATPRAAMFKQANTAGAAGAHPQYAGQTRNATAAQNMSHVQGQAQYAPHRQVQEHAYQPAPHAHPSEAPHEEARR
jgi:hypothetical protein